MLFAAVHESAIGPSRHIAPPRILGRKRGIAEIDRPTSITGWKARDPMYGPAVRCKLNLQNGSGWSCASVSGPCVEQIAPGHHGYPRAFGLILRSALEGQLGHQITNATARPFSILQIQLADLGGDGTSAAREAAN